MVFKNYLVGLGSTAYKPENVTNQLERTSFLGSTCMLCCRMCDVNNERQMHLRTTETWEENEKNEKSLASLWRNSQDFTSMWKKWFVRRGNATV